MAIKLNTKNYNVIVLSALILLGTFTYLYLLTTTDSITRLSRN